MKIFKMFLLLNVIVLLYGCNRTSINDRFFLEKMESSNGIELIYLDDNDNMFRILDAEIIAHQLCGNYIFITQQSQEGLGKRYYIVDIRLDYTNEHNRPLLVSKGEFEQWMKEGCGRR